jgi:DNA-binding NarL/FixJ family response regulator
VRGISRAAPDATIVVLAQVEDVDDLLDCIRAGAIGYVPAPIDAAHLRRIISAVHANEAVVPRSMVRDLVLELRGGSAEDGALTNRERQVLRLLRRGQNTGAIAQRLGIAPVTVRRHISDIVRKLGFEDRETLASGGQS